MHWISWYDVSKTERNAICQQVAQHNCHKWTGLNGVSQKQMRKSLDLVLSCLRHITYLISTERPMSSWCSQISLSQIQARQHQPFSPLGPKAKRVLSLPVHPYIHMTKPVHAITRKIFFKSFWNLSWILFGWISRTSSMMGIASHQKSA